MEGNIFRVKKIVVDDICTLSTGYTRVLQVYDEDRKVFEVTLFAEKEKDLEISVTKTSKI